MAERAPGERKGPAARKAGEAGRDLPRCGPCGPAWLELTFPSRAEYLALIRSSVRWFASRSGFAEKETSRIVLAVVEATTNIIRHAYDGDPGRPIHLRAEETADGIELEFLDQGKGAPASALEEKKQGPLTPGGLGVHMMKTCMDQFCYEPREGGGARLVLRKVRSPAGGLKGSK